MASALIGIALVAGFACLAALGVRRVAGATLRADEALALGAAAIFLVGVTGYLVAHVTDLPLVVLSVALVAGGAAGLAGGLVVVRNVTREGRRPRSLVGSLGPGVLVAAVSVVVALVVGQDFLYATNYRSDPVLRDDAVKELVWSDSADSLGGDPPLASENRKYAGYLAARAAVTKLTGEAPFDTSLGWIVICAVGLGTAVFSLARNLGLPSWAAGVATAAMPLLGGDAYRVPVVGEPRAVATTAMLAGLILISRAITSQGRQRLAFALMGGALAGIAAVIHVQYVLIVASVLAPLLLVVLALGRRLGDVWRPVAVASVAAAVVMLLAVPQLRTFSTASLAEASAERTSKYASGKELIESGDSVWPPRIVSINETDILYATSWFYSLSPRTLVDSVWGERTAPLLALVGLIAAVAIRRRTSPLFLALLLAAALLPLLVQFNPFVFPIFTTVFSSYRSEYIGFEFGYFAVAAIVLSLVLLRRRAVPIAAIAVIAIVPVIDSSLDWYRLHDRRNESRYDSQFSRAIEQIRDRTRHSDLVIARADVWGYAATTLPQRIVIHPRQARMPSPYSPRSGERLVLRSLRNVSRVRTARGVSLAYPRVVVVLDRGAPIGAPIRRLVRDGKVRKLAPGENPSGLYVAFTPRPPARPTRL
jgi:hypothetical protein